MPGSVRQWASNAKASASDELNALKEACFSVFYLMSENLEVAKNATFMQWLFGIMVLFIDFGQLIGNIVDPSFGWSEQADSDVGQLDIAALTGLDSLPQSTSRFVSLLCNFIVLSALVITSLVISEFKGQKFQRVWAAKLLRFLYGGNEASAVAALFGALFSSIFEFGIAPLKCTFWEGVLVDVGAHCTSFDFPRAIFSTPVLLLAVFHSCFSTLSTLMFLDINPLSPAPLALFTGRGEAAFVLFKTFAIVLPTFNPSYPGFNGAVLTVFATLLLIDFIYELPYHRKAVNFFRIAMLGCISWLCLASLIVTYLDSDRIMHILLLPGMVTCASVSVGIAHIRFKRIELQAKRLALTMRSLAKALRRRRLIKTFLSHAKSVQSGQPMTPMSPDGSHGTPRAWTPRPARDATPGVPFSWNSSALSAAIDAVPTYPEATVSPRAPSSEGNPPPIGIPKLGVSGVVAAVPNTRPPASPRAMFLGERDNTEFIEPSLVVILKEWVDEQVARRAEEHRTDVMHTDIAKRSTQQKVFKLPLDAIVGAKVPFQAGPTSPLRLAAHSPGPLALRALTLNDRAQGLLEQKSRPDCSIILQLLITALSQRDDDRCSTWLASFTHFVLGDADLAIRVLEMTKGQQSWLDMDYFHFAIRQNIKQRNKSKELGGRLVSTIGLMELTKEHDQAKQYHFDTVRFLRAYWDVTGIARKTDLAVQHLTAFSRAYKMASVAFLALSIQWPNSSALLRSHARFLDDVNNDAAAASVLDRKASRIESGHTGASDSSDYSEEDESRSQGKSVTSRRSEARSAHSAHSRGSHGSRHSYTSASTGASSGHSSSASQRMKTWRHTILQDEIDSLRMLYWEVFSVIVWLLILATIGLIVIDVILFSGSAERSLLTIFEVASLRNDLVRLMFRVRDLAWASYDRDASALQRTAADIALNSMDISTNMTQTYLAATGSVATWFQTSTVFVRHFVDNKHWSLLAAPVYETVISLARRVRTIHTVPMATLASRVNRTADMTPLWDLSFVSANVDTGVLAAMENLMLVLEREVSAFVLRAQLGVALNAVLNATLAMFIVNVVTRSISRYVLHFRTATIVTATSLHLKPETRAAMQSHYRDLEKRISNTLFQQKVAGAMSASSQLASGQAMEMGGTGTSLNTTGSATPGQPRVGSWLQAVAAGKGAAAGGEYSATVRRRDRSISIASAKSLSIASEKSLPRNAIGAPSIDAIAATLVERADAVADDGAGTMVMQRTTLRRRNIPNGNPNATAPSTSEGNARGDGAAQGTESGSDPLSAHPLSPVTSPHIVARSTFDRRASTFGGNEAAIAARGNGFHFSVLMRARLQVLLCLAGLLVFGATAHSIIMQVVVGSPRFTDIVEMKDLIADLLPPPGYIIEAFFMLLQIDRQLRHHAPNITIEASIDELWLHEQIFYERSRYWKDALPEGPMREEMAVSARVPAAAFFRLMRTEFVPAVLAGNVEAMPTLLGRLETLFDEHVIAIVATVDLANIAFKDADAETAKSLAAFETAVIAAGTGLMALVAAFGFVYQMGRTDASHRKLFGRRVPKLSPWLLGALLALSLGSYFFACYTTGRDATIDGPKYAQMVAMKDLIADIVPPPAYLIESYLHMSRLVADLKHPGGIDRAAIAMHTDRIATLHDEFVTRQEFWVATLFEGSIRTSLTVDSFVSGELLISIYDNELLPALEAGNISLSVSLIDGKLLDAFREHRSNVARTVSLCVNRAQALQTEATVAVPLAWITCSAMGASCLLIGLFFIWVVRASKESTAGAGELKAVSIVAASSPLAASILSNVTKKLKADTAMHMRPATLWLMSTALLTVIVVSALLPLRHLPVVQNLAALSNQAGRLISTSSRCIHQARELGLNDPFDTVAAVDQRLALRQCIKRLREVYEGVRNGGEFGITVGAQALNGEIEDILLKSNCFLPDLGECDRATGQFAHASKSGLNFLMNFVVDVLGKVLTVYEQTDAPTGYAAVRESPELEFLARNFDADLIIALTKVSALLKQQADELFRNIHAEQRVLYGVYIFFAYVCFFLGLIRNTVVTLNQELLDAKQFVTVMPAMRISAQDGAALRLLLSGASDGDSSDDDDDDTAALQHNLGGASKAAPGTQATSPKRGKSRRDRDDGNSVAGSVHTAAMRSSHGSRDSSKVNSKVKGKGIRGSSFVQPMGKGKGD